MISADLVFLLIAGVAFLGLVLDALFDRIRVTSVLPLMLLGIALVWFHIIPSGTLQGLNDLVPFVTSLTVAFVLFHVGLGIHLEELSRVLGRALAFTLVVQVATGVALAGLALLAFHWPLLICFVFGFGLSGPSSISVPVLVRVAKMPESLRTSLLFESVMSDLLQLLVPLLLVGLWLSGDLSTVHVGAVLGIEIVGSTVIGVVAAVCWLWILDRIGPVAREYSWTLTITMVLATYGIADYLGMSAAITIFVFGLLIGNRRHLEFTPFDHVAARSRGASKLLNGLRRALGLRADGVDIGHIQQVQKEVSFFASAFFFVYIGLLFQFGSLSWVVLAVPVLAALVMLAIRFAGSPLLAGFLSPERSAQRSERSLLCFNIPRGLAAAIVATLPLAKGLVIPDFLDLMFLAILFSTIASTVGIALLYDSGPPRTEPPLRPAEPSPSRTDAVTRPLSPDPAGARTSYPSTDPSPPPLPLPRSPPSPP